MGPLFLFQVARPTLTPPISTPLQPAPVSVSLPGSKSSTPPHRNSPLQGQPALLPLHPILNRATLPAPLPGLHNYSALYITMVGSPHWYDYHLPAHTSPGQPAFSRPTWLSTSLPVFSLPLSSIQVPPYPGRKRVKISQSIQSPL